MRLSGSYVYRNPSLGCSLSKIAAKANKSLGLIRRSLKPCSAEVKERTHMTLVRPTLDYASSSWNHYTDTYIKRLEEIQKNSLCMQRL